MRSAIVMIVMIFLSVLVVGCDRDEEGNESIAAPTTDPVWSAVAQDGRLTVRASVQEQAVYVFISTGGAIQLEPGEFFGAPSANQEQVVFRVGRGQTAASFEGEVDRFIEVDLGHNDEFGHSIAVAGSAMAVVIGAPGTNGGSGALYVVEIKGSGVGELLMADHQIHRVDAGDLKYLFSIPGDVVEMPVLSRVGEEIRIDLVDGVFQWSRKRQALTIVSGEYKLSRSIHDIMHYGLLAVNRLKALVEGESEPADLFGPPPLPDAFPQDREEDDRTDLIDILSLTVDAMEGSVITVQDRVDGLEKRLHGLDGPEKEKAFFAIARMNNDIKDLWDEVDDLSDAVRGLRKLQDVRKIDQLIRKITGDVGDATEKFSDLEDQFDDLEELVLNLEE